MNQSPFTVSVTGSVNDLASHDPESSGSVGEWGLRGRGLGPLFLSSGAAVAAAPYQKNSTKSEIEIDAVPIIGRDWQPSVLPETRRPRCLRLEMLLNQRDGHSLHCDGAP
jgi:hypothetical protein